MRLFAWLPYQHILIVFCRPVIRFQTFFIISTPPPRPAAKNKGKTLQCKVLSSELRPSLSRFMHGHLTSCCSTAMVTVCRLSGVPERSDGQSYVRRSVIQPITRCCGEERVCCRRCCSCCCSGLLYACSIRRNAMDVVVKWRDLHMLALRVPSTCFLVPTPRTVVVSPNTEHDWPR